MKKFDTMIVATFISTIFSSATYPFIYKVMIEAVTDNIIATNQIVGCVSTIFFGMLWNKYRKMFNFFPMFLVLETLADISVMVYTLVSKNYLEYYILLNLTIALYTRNVLCGNNRLKAIRYASEDDRSNFDNLDNSAYSLATIIGSIIAIRLNLKIEVMIIAASVGNALDNLLFYLCYKETMKKE